MVSDVASCSSELVQCRICHDEDENSKLEIPCSCSGSLKYAHRKCIQRWCDQKGDTTCEICREQYQPDYTVSPPPLGYDGTFRADWEFPRRDLHNSQFIAIPYVDREFLEAPYDDDFAPSHRSLICCRVVAIIFMVLLMFRHTLPILTSEAGEYSLTLVTLLALRVVAILLPIYIIVKAISSMQVHGYNQNRRVSMVSSDEENELPQVLHLRSRIIHVQ